MNKTKYAAKLVSFDRALPDSKDNIPDEVRILKALHGEHHTIILMT
jgi:hypothetical protein